MTTEQFEKFYGMEALTSDLENIVKSQTPTGMNTEGGMVRDLVETTDNIQMWLMQKMAGMRDHKWQHARQYLSATNRVIGVAGLVLMSVTDAVVDEG